MGTQDSLGVPAQAPSGSPSQATAIPNATCGTCRHIGVYYWDDGFRITHHCLKERERRAESMPAGSDLFAHFRAFFDADANQKACRHYEERPAESAEVIALLQRLAETGVAELKFWSDESRLANDLSGKFVRQMQYDRAPNGYRTWQLLPVGRAALARATGTQA